MDLATLGVPEEKVPEMGLQQEESELFRGVA